MSFWKGVLSVGQALLNPAGAVIKAVQRDKVYEAAGASNASLVPVSNITNRLDATSQYTAEDLRNLLDGKQVSGSGFDFSSFLQTNGLFIAVGFAGLLLFTSSPSKGKHR